MKKTLYNILSPDGFTIRMEPFKTRTSAVRYFHKWKKAYVAQWYYSTRNRERIHPDDLDRECSLVEA